MSEELQRLKFVRSADVYKAGVLAGRLDRKDRGSVAFSYTLDYLASGASPVATTLPLTQAPVESPSGALPAFFSGLLPEGHRQTALKNAVKTSLLKLDPPLHPHLVVNEAAHLTGAKGLKIPVAAHRVVTDRNGLPGLLVERFDRLQEGADGKNVPVRLSLEDATQVLNLPPASKYAVSSEEAVLALAALCKARPVAVRNLYLQFVFAWLGPCRPARRLGSGARL